MEQDQPGEATYINQPVFERNRQVVKHLRALGILPLDGYRLGPALGSQVTKVPNIPIE